MATRAPKLATVEDEIHARDEERGAARMLELSVNESLVDDVTQVIQRTPYICRYPKRFWTVGLVSEFADALDRLSVKLAELQGADR